MDNIYINICRDFSKTPGARLISEGKYSGEEFRESLLIPKFNEALKDNKTLIIDLDGGFGNPVSFLDEAFGGLARIYGAELVLSHLEFISQDEPSLIGVIKQYIYSANEKK